MLITFTGPQSSGKSTLIERCKQTYGDRFEYVGEIARTVARQGLKINEDGGDIGQLLIINKHLENSLKQNAILDRCIVDALMYSLYSEEQGKIADWVMKYCLEIYTLTLNKYDLIFYTDPEIPLEIDGVRSSSLEFRAAIVKHFENFLEAHSAKKNIIRLVGNVEERFALVASAIESFETK